MSKILLLEDDSRLGENIKFNLELRGFQVVLTESIEAADTQVQEQQFDAGLLDVELPDGNGLEFCEKLRNRNAHIPILMISAKDDERTVVRGLELGADDYIRKPFGMKELATRLEKLLNKHRRKAKLIELGGLKLDMDHLEASYRGYALNLARREFDLLCLFANYPGRVYTRGQLVDHLGGAAIIQERTIDSHISHLRRKLKVAGCEELSLKSVYGSGYQLSRK